MNNQTLTGNEIIDALENKCNELKKRFYVKRIGLFGSYIKDNHDTESDIDFLVEFEYLTFDNYMDLKFFLEELFHSDIDLVIYDTIKPRLKPIIMSEVKFVQGL